MKKKKKEKTKKLGRFHESFQGSTKKAKEVLVMMQKHGRGCHA
jgi:hypothetical protein